MNKLLLITTLIYCVFAYALQPLPASSIKESKVISQTRGSTLADSLGGVPVAAFGVNSQNFLDSVLAGYNNSAADDVNIPACESWSVDVIEVAGTYFDPLMTGMLGPAVDVSVYIFEDLPGEPDTSDYANALYSYENLSYTDVGSGDFSIPLPSGTILEGGASGATYWVAVRANLAILSGGQWGWSESSVDLGSNVSQWQQSNAGVLTGINGCVMDWDNRTTCIPIGTNSELGMVLSGQIMSKGVSVSPTTINLIEGGAMDGFDVVLDAPSCDTVDINIGGNDATETTLSTNLLSFNASNWDIPQTVTLTPAAPGDGNDGDINFALTTTANSVGDVGYDGLAGTNVDVTVMNIEGIATILVSPSSGIIVDEVGTMSQIVNFSTTSVPTADITIDLSNNSPTEVSLSAASVVLTAGNGFSENIIIIGVADNIVENTQAFMIVTEPAVTMDPGFSGVNPADISGTVTDDNNAEVMVTAANTPLQTSEAGATDSIEYVLSAQPSANVSFNLFVSDTSEASLSSSVLTFTSANWNVSQQITVTGLDDDNVDGDTNYTVSSSPTSSTDAFWNNLAVNQVSGTNADNDVAIIQVTPNQNPLQTDETGVSDTIDYVLTFEPLADVSFTLLVSDATEASVSTPSLTFTVANWDVAQTVTVTGLDDDLVDGNQSFMVDAGSSTSADPAWNGLTIMSVNGTNTDNDVAIIQVTPNQNPLQTDETGVSDTIDYVLTSEPLADVSFTLSVSDTTEASVSTPSLTFTVANWGVAQTVTVTGLDDDLVDGNQSFTVDAGSSTSVDPAWNGLTIMSVNGTNVDTGVAVVNIITAQTPIQTSESGATDSIQYVLSSQPSADVSFNLTVSDSTEAMVSPTTLIFTPANWNQTQKVIVTGLDDNVNDTNNIYYIIASNTISSDPIWNGLSIPQIQGINVGIQIIPTLSMWSFSVLILLILGVIAYRQRKLLL